MHFDVFNGDADGICGLHQLRLAEPINSCLVTGVKRDIKLLAQLCEEAGADDTICVFDISMESNKDSLLTLLEKGCSIFYADHHFAGDIPDHSNLEAHIDASPDICTSLIIDRLLHGKYRAWAVAAAFGDNLHDVARQAAAPLELSVDNLAALRELGELMNYNGYGASPDDLHFTPRQLYDAVKPFADPFIFIMESETLARLRAGFEQDMANGGRQKPIRQGVGRIYQFPAQPWSKRVAGVFSNERAREKPDMAHALLVNNGNGTFMVSVRAPLNRKKGADILCRAFPTGGGRAAAAGVNELPADMVDQFITAFEEIFTP